MEPHMYKVIPDPKYSMEPTYPDLSDCLDKSKDKKMWET